MSVVLASAYRAAGAAVGALTGLRSLVSTGETAERLRERRGLWSVDGRRRSAWIWIHGSSVGEAAIALTLARALSALRPDLAIVISSATATGRARVKLDGRFESHYFPIDYAPFIKRILASGEPLLFVAVETEIWPETLRVLGSRSVAVSFVNARLSDRSMPRYRRLRPLLGPLLERVALVCARDAQAAARWRELGVPERSVEVIGNIKFDLSVPSNCSDTVPLFARADGRPLLLAASTREGEETLVLEAFRIVRAAAPLARLVVAPRHPERAAEALELARARGFRAIAYGESPEAAADAAAPFPPHADVVVVDRLGILDRAYAAASAAYVGGSLLAGAGGHNLIEAAARGCPVAAGPHLENVADQAECLRSAGALCLVHDVDQLASFWMQVIRDPRVFDEPLEHAKLEIARRAGAVEKTARRLVSILPAASNAGAAARGSAA